MPLKPTENIVINNNYLRERYKISLPTIRNYEKDLGIDIKSGCTLDQYEDLCEKCREAQRQNQLTDEINSDLKLEDYKEDLDFEDKRSSLEKRYQDAKDNYNYFKNSLALNKDKHKEAIERGANANTLAIFYNMVVTSSKSLNMWDNRLDDIENKLGYKNERKKSPIDD